MVNLLKLIGKENGAAKCPYCQGLVDTDLDDIDDIFDLIIEYKKISGLYNCDACGEYAKVTINMSTDELEVEKAAE